MLKTQAQKRAARAMMDMATRLVSYDVNPESTVRFTLESMADSICYANEWNDEIATILYNHGWIYWQRAQTVEV